eukprot:8643010-Pyramimonas_sp.AAC.1
MDERSPQCWSSCATPWKLAVSMTTPEEISCAFSPVLLQGLSAAWKQSRLRQPCAAEAASSDRNLVSCTRR